jgi:hypothetical protein
MKSRIGLEKRSIMPLALPSITLNLASRHQTETLVTP